ncbi:hypothetical protein BS47DRAFT_1385489 [Hydnum rufescens UP504]|uniref:Secreted protein n=1 Tax=Hydnum rufescens UP504 TaxID=1448309 RepID=A0A9P6DM90_9AGAM|nr:hypothetical protein BS47DRAFT_1385489 [Hydnum rufescens UP504]
MLRIFPGPFIPALSLLQLLPMATMPGFLSGTHPLYSQRWAVLKWAVIDYGELDVHTPLVGQEKTQQQGFPQELLLAGTVRRNETKRFDNLLECGLRCNDSVRSHVSSFALTLALVPSRLPLA